METNTPILDDSLLLNNLSTDRKAVFYRKTYLHLALAFFVFLLLEVIFLSSPAIVKVGLSMTQGYTWLIVLGGFMLVTNVAERWALRARSIQMQYAGFFLYILAEAFIFVPLLYIAMYYTNDDQLLTKAFIVTLGLFGGLTAVVFLTRKDFSFLRSMIAIGSIIALGAIVAGIAFGFNLGLFFMVAMVVLAAASILYQTSNMIHKYEEGQHVAASLGLFASFMLLLWYVIQIFLSRD
jgi:hypothetical protein